MENMLKAEVRGRNDEKHDLLQSVRWFSGEGLNVGGIEYGARSYWLDCDIL